MTTMTQDQLRAIFHYLKVPASAYDLGNNTRLDACATIEHTSQGWEVYGIERNSKYDIEVFSNETDACYNLLCRMTYYSDVNKTLPKLTIRTNCYSMEWTEQGWEVFFAVNGEKHDVTVFGNETDACLDLLYKVMHR